jgi:hypothetical protein
MATMAEQMRPASPQQAPDPSNAYERSHPERESGQGRLDNNMRATPARQDDKADDAVTNRSTPRETTAHDITNARKSSDPGEPSEPAPDQPEHSMKDEEPMGWDQAPQDIHEDRQKRHPRTEGRGGTP